MSLEHVFNFEQVQSFKFNTTSSDFIQTSIMTQVLDAHRQACVAPGRRRRAERRARHPATTVTPGRRRRPKDYICEAELRIAHANR